MYLAPTEVYCNAYQDYFLDYWKSCQNTTQVGALESEYGPTWEGILQDLERRAFLCESGWGLILC